MRIVSYNSSQSFVNRSPAAAQPSPGLSYQNRGRYREGIRTAPSTGPNVDLIAALVDYHEPYSRLPATFRMLFYSRKKIGSR